MELRTHHEESTHCVDTFVHCVPRVGLATVGRRVRSLRSPEHTSSATLLQPHSKDLMLEFLSPSSPFTSLSHHHHNVFDDLVEGGSSWWSFALFPRHTLHFHTLLREVSDGPESTKVKAVVGEASAVRGFSLISSSFARVRAGVTGLPPPPKKHGIPFPFKTISVA